MKIFIDTANIEEIKKANDLGVICGVTTNPTLIAKEGRDFTQVVKEISDIVDGPISAEVISLEKEKMIAEADELVKIHKNIVIKLPICEEGLKACSVLSKRGVKVNMTLIFSTAQALLAARAGAAYVSPFIGRIDDIGWDGMTLVEEISDIFTMHSIDTEIIAASIRTVNHAMESAKAGADIATIPYAVIKKMYAHPLTDAGIEKFMNDWEKM